MSVHKLAARCRLCSHCLACLWLLRRWRHLAHSVPGRDGESLQWSRRHRSQTFCIGRLLCVRWQASVESLAANCARRGVAACGQDVLHVVVAAGVVFPTCLARETVASRGFRSLCRANFSSPKFALKPALDAMSVHRMHVCAAVKLQTCRTGLTRTDTQSLTRRESFQRAVSCSNRLCFTRNCHAVVYHGCVNKS